MTKRETTLQNYRRVYALLKRYGHTPAKAIEIVQDAKRGDRHALDWIRTCHRASEHRAYHATYT